MSKFKIGTGLVIGFILGFLVTKIVPDATSTVAIFKIDPAVVLSDINDFRGKNGLSTLTETPTVCAMARTRLPEVMKNWSHTGFSAERFCVFNCHIGENLARNFRSEEAILNGWENSPSHREIMSMPDMKYGCVASNGQYTVLEVSSTIPY